MMITGSENVTLYVPDVKYAYLSETWATFPNRG